MKIQSDPVQETDSSYYLAYYREWVTRRGYVGKAIVVFFLATGFLLYRVAYNMDLTHDCYCDFIHEISYPINRMTNADPHLWIIFIGQELMDISVFFSAIAWFFKSKNSRLPSSVTIFFMFRFILLVTEQFPYPEDIVWRKPFIPSLIIPYDRTRDFYFSGHTGMAVILSLQMATGRWPTWMIGYSYFTVAWMLFMLTVTRVHFTIDVIGGFLFGLLSYNLTVKYLVICDHVYGFVYVIYLFFKNRLCPASPTTGTSLIEDEILQKNDKNQTEQI